MARGNDNQDDGQDESQSEFQDSFYDDYRAEDLSWGQKFFKKCAENESIRYLSKIVFYIVLIGIALLIITIIPWGDIAITSLSEDVTSGDNNSSGEIFNVNITDPPREVDVNESSEGNFTVEIVSVQSVESATNITIKSDPSREIRLMGVSTPSSNQSLVSPSEYGLDDTEANRTCLAEWGDAGHSYTNESVVGNQVLLVTEKNVTQENVYYVGGNNEYVSANLVENGYGKVTSYNFSDRDMYLELESSARENELGVWGCPSELPEA